METLDKAISMETLDKAIIRNVKNGVESVPTNNDRYNEFRWKQLNIERNPPINNFPWEFRKKEQNESQRKV